MVRGRAGRRSERWIVRVFRRLGWTRNPLYRTSDRVEGLLLLGVLIAALVAVPLAVAAGRASYESGIRTSHALAAKGHWGSATLLQNAPTSATSESDSASLTSLARAKWRTPEGDWRRGKIPVRAGTEAGTEVKVWINDSGAATRPPLRPSQVSDKAVATGLTTWMALELGVAIAYIMLRWLVDRRRLASWDAEWARVAPRWTRKSR
jgi:hypothetical protein